MARSVQVGLDGGRKNPFLAYRVTWLMVRMKSGTACVCVFIKPSPPCAIDRWPISNIPERTEVRLVSWERKFLTILAMPTLSTERGLHTTSSKDLILSFERNT